MSLGLAILTDEGAVLAAESLGTLIGQEHQELKAICSKCKKEVKPNMTCTECNGPLGPTPTLSRTFPASHTNYCQKLFKINTYSGVMIVGSPSLGETKAQHGIFAFINWLEEKEYHDDYVSKIITHWSDFCKETKILEKHKGFTELLFVGIKEKEHPVPFGIPVKIQDGKIAKGKVSTYGVIAAGVHEILEKIFDGSGIQKYPVREFPLQDAVEFAMFLMQTQIGIDKYSAIIPRVGGDVDVAVIHPVHGFKWVRQKALQSILES